MQRLAIVAAMHEELHAVLQAMPDERRIERAGRTFWCGHGQGRELVAVLSGIGKVAAAATTALLAAQFEVDGILFTGVAGGLAPGVDVGDIVVADELLQHDLDASPLFPRYEIPGRGRSRLPTDTALTALVAQASVHALQRRQPAATGTRAPRVHRGLIVSGDRFVSTTAENQALCAALPDALAVEMEGAAVAQVCHDFGLPFAVVRTVSDRADAQAHTDFARFVAEVASRHTLDIVQETLQRL